jgi:hypothetical protein
MLKTEFWRSRKWPAMARLIGSNLSKRSDYEAWAARCRQAYAKAAEIGGEIKRRIAPAEPALFLVLGTLLFFGIFARSPVFPSAGLDHSWRYAMLHGLISGWDFARDFSFTGGPLSFLYSGLFDSRLYPLSLALYFFQAITVTVSLLYLPTRYLTGGLLYVLLFLIGPIDKDALLILTTFSVFSVVVNPRVPTLVRYAVTVFAGTLGLAKFTFMLGLICLLGLIDVTRWLEQRRLPVFLPIFLLSTIIIYTLAGQNPLLFPLFFWNSLDVAVGYSAAMDNFGLSARPVFFGIVLLCASGVVAAVASRGPFSWRRVAVTVGFAGFMFILFKASIVRDGHDQLGWQAFPGCFVLALAGAGLSLRWANIPGVAMALVLALSLPFASPPFTGGIWMSAWWATREHVLDARRLAYEPVVDFNRMTGLYQANNAQSEANIAVAAPSGITGTVGSVPWDLSEIIAAGYDVVPQPSLQSYASYTARLRARDFAHFQSDDRPETLIFELKTIDERFPTLDLGESFLEILANYDFQRMSGGAAVLANRDEPRVITRERLMTREARLGEWVDLPPVSAGYLDMRLRARPTIGGRVQGFLLKYPHLWMDVRYGDGGEATFRVVPAMAETGMVLIDRGETTIDLFGPDILAPEAGGGSIIGIRLRTMGWPFNDALHDEVSIEVDSVVLTGEAGAVAPRLLTGRLMAGRAELPFPLHRISQGLLAHSDSTLTIEVESGSSYSGTFGFRPEAYEQGPPNGTLFRIRMTPARGPSTTLFEYHLNPGELSDRRPHAFTIDIPADETGGPVTLSFEIRADDGINSYGWTYWGDPL